MNIILHVLLTLWVIASPANAGISDTLHNLSRTGPGQVKSLDETQICVFCHAPHVPGPPVDQLWNREVPKGAPVSLYKTGMSTLGSTQPDGASKLCLSCHDGTIALGKLLNRKKPVRMTGTGPRGELSTKPRANKPGMSPERDHSGVHPLSIRYNDAETNRRSEKQGQKIGVESELRKKSAVPHDLLDPGGKVQCISCHDPHQDKYYSPGVTPRFWRRTTVEEVCISCHTW